MPSSAKPRKKYRPKPVMLNTIQYVAESVLPVERHEGYLVNLKLRNELAMEALLKGRATRQEVSDLIAMSNICEALVRMGFGADYKDEAVAGREAIIRITHRATVLQRYVATGPETNQLRTLMELHDAQMAVITVRDMEKAINLAKKELDSGKALKLPVQPNL